MQIPCGLCDGTGLVPVTEETGNKEFVSCWICLGKGKQTARNLSDRAEGIVRRISKRRPLRPREMDDLILRYLRKYCSNGSTIIRYVHDRLDEHDWDDYRCKGITHYASRYGMLDNKVARSCCLICTVPMHRGDCCEQPLCQEFFAAMPKKYRNRFNLKIEQQREVWISKTAIRKLTGETQWIGVQQDLETFYSTRLRRSGMGAARRTGQEQ